MRTATIYHRTGNVSRIEAENNCEVERAERCQVWRGKKVQEGKRSVGYEAGTECHLTVGIVTISSPRPCGTKRLFTPEAAGQTGGGGG